MSEDLFRDVEAVSIPAFPKTTFNIDLGIGTINSQQVNSEKPPYQYSIDNFRHSKVKVDLFYNDDDSPKLKDNITEVLKKTFSKAFETGSFDNHGRMFDLEHIDTEKDLTVKVFLFDDKNQCISAIKKIDDVNVSEKFNGYTSKSSDSGSVDIYVYKNFDATPRGVFENLYFGLAKEFFHSLYKIKYCDYQIDVNTKPTRSAVAAAKRVEDLEKMLAWKISQELGHHNNQDFNEDLYGGASIIESNKYSLDNMLFQYKGLNQPKIIYEIANNFILNQHPDLLTKIIDYNYLSSLDSKAYMRAITREKYVEYLEILRGIKEEIESPSYLTEFSYWVSNITRHKILSDMENAVNEMKKSIDELLDRYYPKDEEREPNANNDWEGMEGVNTTIDEAAESYLKDSISNTVNSFDYTTSAIQQDYAV